MGRRRDEADVALGVAVGPVVGADREQAGELALGARVGLQRDGVVPGDLGQPALQVLDEAYVALHLVGGGVGVDAGELGPADRLHLGRGVELHRAGAQRDHRPVERDVLVLKLAQVAEHRGLGTVGVEHRVGEEVRGAQQPGGQRVGGGGVQVVQHDAGEAERLPDRPQVGGGGLLVAGDAHVVGVGQAEVDPPVPGRRDDLGGPAGDAGEHGVEEVVVHDLDVRAAQTGREHRGVPVGALGDAPEPLGAVVDGVHAGDHGEQHLRRADVAGGLLAADVLLAGLQGEPVRRAAVGVLRDPDQAPGHLPLEPLAHRHVGGVRAAEPEGDAEALGGADGDVGAHGAGGLHQGQRDEVGGGDHQGAAGVGLVGDGAEVLDLTAGARVLDEHAEQLAVGQAPAEVGLDQLDAERLRTGGQHGLGLRERVGVHDEHRGLRAAGAAGQRHGLRRGRGLVEQRGAGDVQPGQVADHGLEVQEGLEASLRDLGLVGRVGGVPAGVLQQVAPDDRRGDRVVVAEPDHRGQHLVAGGERPQLGDGLGLARRLGQVERTLRADRPGDGQGDEVGDGLVAHGLQHARLVGVRRSDVPGGEGRCGQVAKR